MRSDVERRKLNIAESLIIAGLLAMFGMLFWMRDSIVRLTIVIETQAKAIDKMESRMLDVPVLEKRVSKAEADIQSIKDREKERREMEGLR